MNKGHKIWLIISGLLLIALGVVCIIKPAETLFATAWVIGCLTLLSGIAKMVFTFKTEHFMPNSGTRMLSGLLQIIVGIIFLSNNLLVTVSLPVVFSLWVIFEGITLAVQSFDYKKFGFSSWWVFLLLGIVVVLLGFLGMRYLDAVGQTLAVMIGIGIIMVGLAQLFALKGIKYLEKNLNEMREAMQG